MNLVVKQASIFALMTFGLIISTNAQTYVFSYNEVEREKIQSLDELAIHPFGEEFAYKLQLLKEQYTYQEYLSISNTYNTIIEKPSIYQSVRKVNKHLIKSVKKSKMSKEEAIAQLTEIMDKALNIRYQDTEELEEALWKIKDPVAIEELYTKEVSMI